MDNQTNQGTMLSRTSGKLQSGAAWQAMRDGFLQSGGVAEVRASITRAVDAIVREAFEASAAARLRVCVFAVGAAGRSELFPYSDVDLAIVCESAVLSPNLKDAVSQFLNAVRQQGVRPNHRLTTIEECLDLRDRNIDLDIGLLDRRFLAGSDALHAKVERELTGFFAKHGQKICQHLSELTSARHARYRGTPFHLEPDVREAPGGLRDAGIVRTLANLNPGQPAFDDSLESATNLIAAVRCFLHYQAGDDLNVFYVSAQRELAATPAPLGLPSFSMRDYFEAARRIFNATRRALDSFEKSTSLLEGFRGLQSRFSNHEFTVARERVFLRKPAELAADPMMVLRLVEFVAQHGVPPSPETERRLEAACPALASFFARQQPLWPNFRTALTQPHAEMALRMLRDSRALGAIFPEWAAVEGISPKGSDPHFTIDENALIGIGRIAELRDPGDPLRQKFADVVSEVDDLPALLFALLFRESGAAAEDGPAQTPVTRARGAARRIQMPETVLGVVEFLVEHESDLSDAASGRDLDNPSTLRKIASRMGTVERLKLLTALTYASISAAGDAMMQFRLEQLWRTYSAIQHELMQELETDRIGVLPEDTPAYAGFLKGFPLRYLRSRTASEIEADIQLYEESRPAGAAVRIDRIEGAHKMTIVARDAPFLFASFAGAISSFGLDIVKAEAFSNSRGAILDTFVFADPKRTLELNPPEIERLHDLILRVALGKTDATRLLRNRTRPDPKKRTIIPEVRFDSEACDTATLVEIVAEDRQGLLYSLAMVFSNSACNIDVVLIDTKGRRAMDVFYVAQDGRKLSPEMQETLKERILEVC